MDRQPVLDRAPEVTLSPEGERMLEEALEDVRAGRVKRYANMDELIAELADEHSAH